MRVFGGLGAVAAIYTVSCLLVMGEDTKPAEAKPPDNKSTNAPAVKSAKAEESKPAKPAVKILTGAELYSIHCMRCHPERYPTERTAAQWKTILMHMRVRANLPAEQSRTILKYLQENSGR
jgi:hypothetical protein